jgi:signal transduction histidine kinase
MQLEASNQVGQQVTSILDLDELLTAVVKLIQSKFGYYFVGVLLSNESNERLVVQASAGGDERQLQGLSFNLDSDRGIVLRVYQTGQIYLANDVSADEHYLGVAALPNTRSELALPLHVGDAVIGVLDVQSNQLAGFDAEEQRVLQTLANQTAIAIRNVRLYELEKKLNADKDKFFSIISHDLRGPFTNLLGNAQFMLEMSDKLSQKDVNEMTRSIYNGAKAAYSLLDNLFTWSGMQRDGGLECHLEPLELSAVAAETLEVLGQIAADKGIALSSAIPSGLWVQADKYMLTTVLRNLAGNALKFTPRGGQVTLLAQETPTGFVTVSVKDTGIGMSETDQAKLFKIGENYSKLGTEREQGSGLGLIICQEMVQRQGGRIWVESDGVSGQGTVVNFTTPADQPAR